ncbi:hypothetical protein F5880DRAFT_387445, partial [Lentinula raphanica]
INLNHNHWFAFVIDRRDGRNAAYIFGQSTHAFENNRAFHDLQQFRGYLIFRILCALHGWDDRGPDVVNRIDWVQPGGTECGVYVVDLLSKLQQSDLVFTPNRQPILPRFQCTHRTRLDMATYLYRNAIEGLQHFVRLAQELPHTLRMGEGDLHANLQAVLEGYLTAGGGILPQTHQHLQDIKTRLTTVMADCHQCRTEAALFRQEPRVGPPLKPSKSSGKITAQDMVNSYPELRGLKPSREIESTSQCEDSEAENGERTKPIRRGRVNLNQSSATARRYQTTVEPPELQAIARTDRFQTWDDTFDHYEAGPTIEAIARFDEEYSLYADVGVVYFPGFTSMNPLSAHEEYRDRGWRLPSGFCQAFFKHPP